MQRTAAPVGGHLASAAGRIGGRAHGLQHHVVGRNAQAQAQSAIAIVREEPVVAGAEGQRRAHLQRLMACGRNLEEDLLLALEQDFAVVYRAGKKHQPVDFNHLLCASARPRPDALPTHERWKLPIPFRSTPIAQTAEQETGRSGSGASPIPDTASLIVAIQRMQAC